MIEAGSTHRHAWRWLADDLQKNKTIIIIGVQMFDKHTRGL